MSQGFTKDYLVAGDPSIFVNGTSVATTSGTAYDFAIPSGVKEFTLNLNGCQLSGTDEYLVRLGYSGGVVGSGYISRCLRGVTTVAVSSSTGGLNIYQGTSYVVNGTVFGKLMDEATNTWILSFVGGNTTNNAIIISSGSKVLPGELTTVRFQSSGANTFTAGTVNIQYDNQSLGIGSGGISGGTVQTVHVQDGAVATGTATMPIDDTIPQITEGTEFMTASITPTSATNKLRIDVICNISNSTSASQLTAALFQDSTANALDVASEYEAAATGHRGLKMTYWMTAGTTSSTTFKVRAGSHIAGTTTFNGASSNRRFGGVYLSSITITEYEV